MAQKGFELQQVLNFRAEVEKVRTLEFAVARNEHEEAVERLVRDEQEVDRLSAECIKRQSAGISALELQLYADFFQRKRVDIREQRQEVSSLEVVVAEKRETLLVAAKDKKALESLKEKKLSAHRRHQAEKERNFLDEIALMKSVSNK